MLIILESISSVLIRIPCRKASEKITIVEIAKAIVVFSRKQERIAGGFRNVQEALDLAISTLTSTCARRKLLEESLAKRAANG